jgi:deoxycytidylate deaminase
VCALIAASKIYSSRIESSEGSPEAHKRTAHLIVSLKRPEEVETLRRIYGSGFFLIGVFAGESDRRKFLVKRKGLEEEQADDLIDRDQKEIDPSGQRTRDTFQMADVFVSVEQKQYEAGLERFLSLVFGDPFATPTRDEHAMFLAYAASLRSGDLARQVGAALTCSKGEVVALGCNDVPAPGGGLYWADDGARDQRDWVKGYDSNDRVKQQIVEDVFSKLRNHLNLGNDPASVEAEVKSILGSDSKISQIAEFGRSVHAEMDALMAAGRTGVTFRDATLYTTTFPCHTCTRHIVTAGVQRVVYIEPYPKSRAPELHEDAMYIVGEEQEENWVAGDRIPFAPFLGIGPRRFFDLFSLKLSAGYSIERKDDGKKKPWDLRTDSRPRVPMPPNSYLEREQLISTTLNSIKSEEHGERIPDEQTDSGEERQGVLGVVGEDGTPSRKLARVENRKPVDRAQSES